MGEVKDVLVVNPCEEKQVLLTVNDFIVCLRGHYIIWLIGFKVCLLARS